MLVNIPYMEHSGLANISMPDPGISGISCSINAEKKSRYSLNLVSTCFNITWFHDSVVSQAGPWECEPAESWGFEFES